MKDKKALQMTAKNVGALQMSNGRIGDLATLISQNAKTKNVANPTTRGAIADAEDQPARGAWL